MSAKLFVGGLNGKTTRQQLTRFFSSAGLVVSVRMPLDRETGRSRGFAFIEFRDLEQAEQAMRVFNGRELGGSVLRVSIARPEAERWPSGVDRRTGAVSDSERRKPADADQPAGLNPVRSKKDSDPYSEDGRWRRHRRGKHGSDRVHRRGTQRFLD
jgi:RNA recognition motif-containing protein